MESERIVLRGQTRKKLERVARRRKDADTRTRRRSVKKLPQAGFAVVILRRDRQRLLILSREPLFRDTNSRPLRHRRLELTSSRLRPRVRVYGCHPESAPRAERTIRPNDLLAVTSRFAARLSNRSASAEAPEGGGAAGGAPVALGPTASRLLNMSQMSPRPNSSPWRCMRRWASAITSRAHARSNC